MRVFEGIALATSAQTSPVSVNAFRAERLGPEIALQDVIISQIHEILNTPPNPVWVGTSLPIGAGLPDVLAATYSSRVTEITGTSNGDIDIMAYLRVTRRARRATIASRLNQPHGHIVRSLDRLCECGITHAIGEVYSLDEEWKSILPDVMAIEVKVNDWNRGIRQAARNLLFAHRSLLALPVEAALRLKRSREIQSRGIGLISIEGTHAEILWKGTRNLPKVWQYYYQVARAIGENGANRDAV